MMKRAITAMILTGCGVDYVQPKELHDIREQSGTRLKIEWWETAEGTQAYRGIYDNVLGQECSPRQVGSEYFCMPATATGSTAPYARLGHDVEAADARIVPTSFCSADGLVIPDAFHDNTLKTDCSATACGLDLVFARDATRLIPGYWVDGEGLWQHARHLWDTQLSAECEVVETGDGARCMPAAQAGTRTGLEAFALLVPTIDE